MYLKASAEKFSGGGDQRKKDRKIAKKRKVALLSLFQEEATIKKDRKIAKKFLKIALLSLYLIYLHHL